MRPGIAALMVAIAHTGPLAAEPAPAVACAACVQVILQSDPAGAVEARMLCARAAGAFVRLGHWRDAFLAEPRYAELFPVVYWHVTRAELQWVAEGHYTHPLEILRQIDVFFDAYDWNRTRFDAGLPPEPHWAAHFSAAADADREFGQIGRGMAFDTPDTVDQVLSSGVIAHIDFDLPRALRFAFAARQDKQVSADALAADFRAADGIFPIANVGMVADLKATIRATSDWDLSLLRPEVLGWFDEIAARSQTMVLQRRHLAWANAFASTPLPIGDAPQPPAGPRPAIECPDATTK